MKTMSNRVTKQPNIWEIYLYPNAPGSCSYFDGHPMIFFTSLYLLIPAIISSENPTHISP